MFNNLKKPCTQTPPPNPTPAEKPQPKGKEKPQTTAAFKTLLFQGPQKGVTSPSFSGSTCQYSSSCSQKCRGGAVWAKLTRPWQLLRDHPKSARNDKRGTGQGEKPGNKSLAGREASLSPP